MEKGLLRVLFLGTPHPQETRIKISKANKGHIVSKTTRHKISVATSKENSHWWKGGISPENKIIRKSIEYHLWRESVFARDNWICQKCKERGIYLHPHHIRNFARWVLLRFAIDNGITLCEKCHRKFHKKYGKKDNDEIQLKEFMYG